MFAGINRCENLWKGETWYASDTPFWFLRQWSPCLHSFCIRLQTDSSTNIVLIQMPTQTSKTALSAFLGLSLTSCVSVGTTSRPEAILCSLSLLSPGPVCRGHFEEDGHNNDALTHQAARQFPQRISDLRHDIQWADWGAAPATRQISQRGYRGSDSGRHTVFFSPLCFTAAVAGFGPLLSYPGGNTVALHFQTWKNEKKKKKKTAYVETSYSFSGGRSFQVTYLSTIHVEAKTFLFNLNRQG